MSSAFRLTISATLILIASLGIPCNVLTQSAKLPSNEKAGSRESYAVSPQKTKNPELLNTGVRQYSRQELELLEQMNMLKQSDNGNGEDLVRLQLELESINGATKTAPASGSFCRMIPPDGRAMPNSSKVYDGIYVASTAIQLEQRGTTAGKIWTAIGIANADTGAGASADTLLLYYSTDNGATHTQYLKIAFSASNKINFNDLDMEIIENSSGEKYIYMVFGYTTLGYTGQNLIGYTIVRTPTPSVFGSTFFPPGYNTSNKYTRPRITSDNSRYLGLPYVFITYVQDSISGANTYTMPKNCWILSPYNMNPALTYIAQAPFVLSGSGVASMCSDVAYFHNGGDSLKYCLSEVPGFLSDLYLLQSYSNTPGNPIFTQLLAPTGYDLHHARIAANGGMNQRKIAIIYSENYQGTGDWDQYVLRTSDGVNWISDNFDFTSFYNTLYGEIIGRRNADGSFSMAYKKNFASIENMAYATYTGNFTVSNFTNRANPDFANSLPAPKPAFKYQNGDSCLYNWNYYYTAYTSDKCSDIGLYLRYVIEGFYDDVNDNHRITDVVSLYLAEASPPYNFVDTAIMYLEPNVLFNEASFYNAPVGNYYLVIKHRNALQTWSAAPILVNDQPGAYDFTTASSTAYGDNLTLKGSRWCLYSGDVNQDEVIDIIDLQIIDNDIFNFVFGQLLNTDLNGDNFVDVNDILIADNNAQSFISVSKP